jgi:2-oxoglutarate ferredoxin oxidoreductase subunit alpha
MFDCTLKAFNMSEMYRQPVCVLGDEIVGHMNEKVVIPKKEDLVIINRKKPKVDPSKYLPFAPDDDLVPPMACAGEGYRVHVTGLTHDERGHPIINAETQEKLVARLVDKIRKNAPNIIEYEEIHTKGADLVVVAYGSVSRCAKEAVRMAREEKIKVGMVRPITVWPFPEDRMRKLSEKVKAFIVPEVNYGQVAYEVERCVSPNSETHLLPRMGGDIHTPEEILEGIKEMV